MILDMDHFNLTVSGNRLRLLLRFRSGTFRVVG
jgi:hypothetical protein